jgi:hypothetical protein
MGKVSPKDRETRTARQKRRLKSSNKYLRPGALAQLRYSKASATKSCTDLGKKRVALVDADKATDDVVFENNTIDGTPTVLSPVRFGFGASVDESPAILSPTGSGISPFCGPFDIFKQNNLQEAPKTPCAEECESSRLESLPMDLLVLNFFILVFVHFTKKNVVIAR